MQIHDGAYGTLLQHHLHGDETVDDLCARAPRLVIDAHRAYLEAGADAIQTNSFLAHLRTSERRRAQLQLAALACAREAAAADNGDARVLATIGPVGSEARGFWRDLELLLTNDAPTVLCETITDRRIADALLLAWVDVASGVDTPLWLGCSVSPSAGADASRWVLELASEAPATVHIGLNCCEGPIGIRPLLEELCTTRGSAWVMPSAGIPDTSGPRPAWPFADADQWADAVGELIDGLPIAAAGGCCGTSPDSIEALRLR